MQTTDTLLMVRPANFGYNAQTASNNSFQNSAEAAKSEEIREAAKAEFDNFVARLQERNINVIVVEDTATPIKPDAIFPNNWMSYHDDGSVFLYPMYAPNRRIERRKDIIQGLKDQFVVKSVSDLSGSEALNVFLEGTGSMILDRENGLVYACISQRTDANLLADFCGKIGYSPIVFHADDREGNPIYHTNVVMAVGETFVVMCLEAVRDEAEKAALLSWFANTEKDLIEISLSQLEQFAGNMLQVKNTDGELFLVMSEQAFMSLNDQQIQQIQDHTEILYAPIYTIETYGGGSARCMMAEVFLPKKEVAESL
jgi:hypothetical protein